MNESQSSSSSLSAEGEADTSTTGEGIYTPMTLEESSDSSFEQESDLSSTCTSTNSSTSISIDHGDIDSFIPPPLELQQHSYLPGTQHPLYPVQFLRNTSSNAGNNLLIGAGGATQPTSTFDGTSAIIHPKTIEIPILQMDIVLFPNTTLPLRITNRTFCEYLKREIDNARASNGDLQVRIGVVTRLKERRRTEFQRRQRSRRSRRSARHTGTRTGAGAGTGTDSDDTGSSNGEDIHTRRSRMGRWNMSLIRRNFETSISPNDDDENSSTRSRNSMNSDTSSVSSEHQDRTHPEERSINYGRSLPRDRLEDRIGTFATVTSVSTTGMNMGNEESSHENQNEASQIIVTALTTGRFQVISPVHVRNHQSVEDDFEWRMYNVREMDDADVSIPSVFRRPRPSRKPSRKTNEVDKSEGLFLVRNNKQLIHDVSNRTSIPSLSLQLMWPAKLVKDIIGELKSIQVYEGLEKSLPDAREQFKGRFSFWLSSNLPLSHMEKLDLLETYSAVERLRLLLHMIRKRTAFIRCKQCRANIAKMSSVFSLHSSAGTSGAYVNEHGAVHHTTTIQETMDGAVVCLGSAETRDSWFPGYSWTIAYCSTCYNHLGWKFLQVTSGLETEQFWGMSGSQIV